MRIALAASSYLPRLGGVEEHVFHLSAELRRRGHEVSVWTVDQGDAAEAGVRTLPCPLPNRSVGGLLRWAAALPRAAAAWRRAIRADRPDLIVIQCFGANGPWAAATARRHGIPLVYANHGETFMDAHDAFATSALLRRTLGETLRDARAVTSCSAYAGADLDRFGEHSPVTVVGNGIDTEAGAEPLGVVLPGRYIAGVGRLVDNKGFDILLRAFARAETALNGLQLVIAGDGPERPALAELARELGIAARVTFTGALQRGQVRTLLDGATAHVIPSRVEAFGIVVLEGWRSGTPVIVTDRGGPPEFVTDGVDGLLFDPESPGRLAELLTRVAHDDGLRARLGAAGARAVGGFSWGHVADRYERVLEDAVIDTGSRSRP